MKVLGSKKPDAKDGASAKKVKVVDPKKDNEDDSDDDSDEDDDFGSSDEEVMILYCFWCVFSLIYFSP